MSLFNWVKVKPLDTLPEELDGWSITRQDGEIIFGCGALSISRGDMKKLIAAKEVIDKLDYQPGWQEKYIKAVFQTSTYTLKQILG